MRLPRTINIQIGRKLSGKTKDEILSEIVRVFPNGVLACQFGFDIIRVTFNNPEFFQRAKRNDGVHLFGMYCNILGGGPPATLVHLFDYPYEECENELEDVFKNYGEVKRVRHQSFSSNKDIFTGTRLISIVLRGNLPRSVTINGYICRIWYRGQPLVCNLCAVQGHRSANCPNKDKCRRCGESGHFARACQKDSRAGHQDGQDHPPEAMNVDPTAQDPSQSASTTPPADDSESARGGHAPPSDNASPPSQPNEGPPPHVGESSPPVVDPPGDSGGPAPSGSENPSVAASGSSAPSVGEEPPPVISVDPAPSEGGSPPPVDSLEENSPPNVSQKTINLSPLSEAANVSIQTDDEDTFEDASDEADHNIQAFTSTPPPSSPGIVSSSEPSQSILADVAPQPDASSVPKVNVSSIDGDPSSYLADDEAGMDTSGASRKRKTSSAVSGALPPSDTQKQPRKKKPLKGSAVHANLPSVVVDRPSWRS